MAAAPAQTALVQFATVDNAFFKPLEIPLPLTHENLLDAARTKFKNVSKASRLYDGTSGSELELAGEVELAAGAKVMVSSKAGWKGSERLRSEYMAKAIPSTDAPAADSSEGSSSPRIVSSVRTDESPPLLLQLVSFSYDQGQPRDTAANVNARGLPNPGKAAMGRTGLDRRLAKEVLACPGASELCERVVQEALRQIQIRRAASSAAVDGDAGPPLLRVGVGCDRGLHRSVALAEAATARLVRKAEHARSGRNSPGLEVLLRSVQLLDVDHRELTRRSGVGGAPGALEEQPQEGGGSSTSRRAAELRVVGGV